MPIKSKKQWRFLASQEPEIFNKWVKHTKKKYKDLPEDKMTKIDKLLNILEDDNIKSGYDTTVQIKYECTFNFEKKTYKPIYTVTDNLDSAKANFMYQISEIVNKTVEEVTNYYKNNPNSYKIKEIEEISYFTDLEGTENKIVKTDLLTKYYYKEDNGKWKIYRVIKPRY